MSELIKADNEYKEWIARILSDVKSFSPTNLKYMRYFYEMYPDAMICPQVEAELITDANRPQVGDDLQIIFRIPWGHNKIISPQLNSLHGIHLLPAY